MEIKKGIIKLIETKITDLKGKVFVSAAPSDTPIPYVVIAEPADESLNTVHGTIVDTTLEVSVFHTRLSLAEEFKEKLVTALDKADIQECRCYFKSAETNFFEDYLIYSKMLIFKII